jgi:hypothetical protein
VVRFHRFKRKSGFSTPQLLSKSRKFLWASPVGHSISSLQRCQWTANGFFFQNEVASGKWVQETSFFFRFRKKKISSNAYFVAMCTACGEFSIFTARNTRVLIVCPVVHGSLSRCSSQLIKEWSLNLTLFWTKHSKPLWYLLDRGWQL